MAGNEAQGRSAKGPASSKADESKAVADKLVRLADAANLFHNSDGRNFAAFPVEQPERHLETHPIKTGLGRWLTGKYYRTYKRSPNKTALESALAVLDARAAFDGPEEPVHVRVAGYEDAIYIDLGDDRWRAVEITANDFRVVADPPVRFRRGNGAGELPVPSEDGDINNLRSLLNLASEADFHLVVGWGVGAFMPTGPYPVLEFQGQHGSAKTSQSQTVTNVIDPAVPVLRSAPSSERDLAIMAANRWVIGLDNLSVISPWLSDALCRVSTGGGFGTRTLYENDTETLFDTMRPVLINGIDELAVRSDLLDRSILVTLPVITHRRTVQELRAQFKELHAGIFGAFCAAISAALKNLPNVTVKDLPRMADFMRWVHAAEPGLGWKPGTFQRAFNANRRVANARALEGNAVGPLVQRFMETTPRWGTGGPGGASGGRSALARSSS